MGSRRAAAAAAATAAASCCRVGGDRPNAGLVGLGLTTVCGGPRLDAFRATGFSVGEAAAMAAKWTAVPVVAVSPAAVLPAGHGSARTVVAAADGGGVGGVLSGGCGGVRSSLAVAAARLSVAAIAAAAAAVAAAAAAGS